MITRTKQILPTGRIVGITTLLLQFATVGNAQVKPHDNIPPKELRLLLTPQAHLQAPSQPIWDDSVEAIVTVAVPDSCKNQRHRCRLEASKEVTLSTIPRLRWALRRDTLMVLSAAPLQIRAARQSFNGARPATPIVLRIHYENLDHTVKTTGTAVLELLPPDMTISPPISSADTMPASTQSSGSTQKKSVSESSGVDFTATGSGFAGILFLAILGLLILLMSMGIWLATRSQRRRSQKIKVEKEKMAFPRPIQTQPSTSVTNDDSAESHEDETREETTTIEKEEPVLMAASTSVPSNQSLPVALSEIGNETALATVLKQLNELNAGLQQVIACQNEANRRLASIVQGTGDDISQGYMRISLFDLLNEESDANRTECMTDQKTVSSQLRFQFDGDSKATGFSVDPASSLPVHIQLAGNDRRPDSLSVDFASCPRLRILFARSENNGEVEMSASQLMSGNVQIEKDNFPVNLVSSSRFLSVGIDNNG